MEQRPCPRCGAPCSVEQCPACGATVPPSAEAIVAGGELLTHGRPEPEADPTPAPQPQPHGKDEADRTVEIPIIRAAPQDTPPPVALTKTGTDSEESSSDRTLPVTGATVAAAPAAPDDPETDGPDRAVPTAVGEPRTLTPTAGAGRRARRGPVLAVALGTVLVLVIGLVLALALREPDVDGVAQPAETLPSAAPAPVTATVTESVVPPVLTTSVPAATTEPAPATSATPSPSPSPSPTPSPSSSAPAQPVAEDIACLSGGWIVQLASERDEAAYAARVTQLQANGQVPAGAKTARTGGSCGIFSTQTNTIVLWSGPFGSQYDACPARWAGPPDAFVKATTPDLARSYVSCLCPADPTTFPVLQAGSTDAVWIGEMQRVLGNRLNQSISDLQGNWGTFTPGTQAAVTAFQQKSGLPATGVVDAATWTAMNAAQC